MIIKFWVAVNKDGFICLYRDMPKRNTELGIWESSRIYLNSVIYPQICNMVKNVMMTWDNDPEYFEMQLGSTTQITNK